MSFNYRVACASLLSGGCTENHGNFFLGGKSLKKDNTGTSAPLAESGNSDSECCIGVF